MRKYFLFLLALGFVGCGSSGGVTTTGLEQLPEGNFIFTRTEVERRLIYSVDRAGNTLSAFLLPDEEEGGHGHAHGRILPQQMEEEHLEFEELDGSPYNLSRNLVDFVVDSQGRFLYVLDDMGRLTTYGVDGATGLISQQGQVSTSVTMPRRLVLSADGDAIAVLGEKVFLATFDAEGGLTTPAFINGTGGWLDLSIRNQIGAAATASGVVGFTWVQGAIVVPPPEVALPGATRGNLTYLEEQLFVVNQADTSVTRLDQAADGTLTISMTFDLPAQLTDPRLIAPIFGAEDLVIADSNSVVLFHPSATMFEEEATTEITRVPASLFYVPETEFVLVGHTTGQSSTAILVEETMMEVSDEPGPGGNGPVSFGFAETTGIITSTTDP